ncbi:MAG: amidohydrolase family protein [Deltaproteobacteria bacterium]|nr:amidohydrolase family protein [Deltaproteobacteria bacterium]
MYDLIIENGKIVDGTGAPAFSADLAIQGERIVKIGNLEAASSKKKINAEGFVVCPGFIDPHGHFDLLIEYFPACENGVIQGITTFVGGNCGMSTVLETPDQFNFPEFLTRIESAGFGINFAPLIGHGAVRGRVIGNDYKRTATAPEIEAMKRLVAEAMQNGAFGLSTGLDYNPTMHSSTEEVIELAKVAQKYGGIYATHHRFLQSKWPADAQGETSYSSYPGDVTEVWFGRYHGLMEAIEIAKAANIPLQVSHLYNVYRTPQPHPELLDLATANATLWLIDQAAEAGVDIAFDRMVTYQDIQGAKPIINEFLVADIAGLKFAKELGREAFLEKLQDPDFRDRIKQLSEDGGLKLLFSNTKADPYWMDRLIIVNCTKTDYVDKTIGDLARKAGKDPLDVIFDLMILDNDVAYHQFQDEKEITEANLPLYLNHPLCMPCSDLLSYPSLQTPLSDLDPIAVAQVIQNINSPHTYNMYPYFIGKYIREKRHYAAGRSDSQINFHGGETIRHERAGSRLPGEFCRSGHI